MSPNRRRRCLGCWVIDGRMAGSLRKINAVCELFLMRALGDGPVRLCSAVGVHCPLWRNRRSDTYFKMLQWRCVVDGRAFA